MPDPLGFENAGNYMKHAKSSALHPLLFAGGGISIVSIYMASLFPEYRALFIGVILVFIIFLLFAYSYFMFKDPDRLQSESYQLARHSQKMQAIDGAYTTVLDSEYISNPAIPHQEQEEVQQ